MFYCTYITMSACVLACCMHVITTKCRKLHLSVEFVWCCRQTDILISHISHMSAYHPLKMLSNACELVSLSKLTALDIKFLCTSVTTHLARKYTHIYLYILRTLPLSFRTNTNYIRNAFIWGKSKLNFAKFCYFILVKLNCYTFARWGCEYLDLSAKIISICKCLNTQIWLIIFYMQTLNTYINTYTIYQ